MVIFGAGVVTGGLLTWRLEQASLVRRPHRTPPPSSPGGFRFEFLRRAQRELDLSPEQRQKIDKILKESQERTRAIMEPVAPQFRAEIRRTESEFRSLLNPEQQKRFDQLLKKPQHAREPRRAQTQVQTNSP